MSFKVGLALGGGAARGLIFAISLHRSSFISEEVYLANFEHIPPKGNIEDCPNKLGLVSMNLDTAEEELSLSENIFQNEVFL